MTTVLIIDDESLLRTTLRSMLEKEHFIVQEAADGRTGLALWRQSPTDVVLTDIFMPNKDGIEVILEIKRTRPQAKIIAMTGGGQTRQWEMVPAAILLGADRTIQKPFDKKTLLAVIKEVLHDPPCPAEETPTPGSHSGIAPVSR